MDSQKVRKRFYEKNTASAVVAASLAIAVILSLPCQLNSTGVQVETGVIDVSVSMYNAEQETFSIENLSLNSENDLDYVYKSSNQAAYVNSNAVLIRSEPDDESEVEFAVDYAYKLYIMGKDVNQSNGWTKVYCNNLSGYIRTECLSSEILFIDDEQYIYISGETVLRTSPEIKDDNIVQTLYQNNRFKQVGYNNDWIKIEDSGNYYYLDANYYSSSMIFVEKEQTMYLSRKTYLRSSPSTKDAAKAIELDIGTAVKQIEYNTDWLKVIYNDQEYYLEAAYANPYYSSYTSNSYSITFNDTEYSGDLATVIETAYSFLGKSYVYGAATPYATDCSGLTMQCYAAVGIYLPHRSVDQAEYGRDVMGEDMQPGDLIMFSSKYSSTISHVAIYVGNGMMIHASNSRTGCIASDVERYCQYGGTIRAVRRFID